MKVYYIVIVFIIISSCNSCKNARCNGKRKDLPISYDLAKGSDTIFLILTKSNLDPSIPVPQWYKDSLNLLLLKGYRIIDSSEFWFTNVDCSICDKVRSFSESNECIICDYCR